MGWQFGCCPVQMFQLLIHFSTISQTQLLHLATHSLAEILQDWSPTIVIGTHNSTYRAEITLGFVVVSRHVDVLSISR